MKKHEALVEALAMYAHNSWSGWMVYMFAKSTVHDDGAVTIPSELVARWVRQMQTPYAELSAVEQVSDQDEAHNICAILRLAGFDA